MGCLKGATLPSKSEKWLRCGRSKRSENHDGCRTSREQDVIIFLKPQQFAKTRRKCVDWGNFAATSKSPPYVRVILIKRRKSNFKFPSSFEIREF
jgi:hypothetical protein